MSPAGLFARGFGRVVVVLVLLLLPRRRLLLLPARRNVPVVVHI